MSALKFDIYMIALLKTGYHAWRLLIMSFAEFVI
jgi:hypothetical protein